MEKNLYRAQRGNTLLVVDDDEINRDILCHIFASQYEMAQAEDGEAGLAYILEHGEQLCAILLDVNMPRKNGIEVMQALAAQKIPSRIPVFLITAEATDAVMRQAYELGVMDVISKPIRPYIVLRRVQSVIELFQARRSLSSQVRRQQEDLLRQSETIIQLNQGMIEALATAIEFRSEESGGHVRRIHDITHYLLSETSMGEGLAEEEITQIALASILHDIGKIAVPDTILNKPGRLTPEEFEIMKTHTVQGDKMLGRIPQLREHSAYRYARDIARHHHERWDGRGYPDGLKGDEISVWAQVVSLADVYDALSCKRVYKDAFPREQVIAMIRGGECGAFNPKLLACFLEVEDQLAKMYKKLEGEKE